MQVTLGRSGLAASRVGLGLAALGRPGYINLGHAQDLAGRTSIRGLEQLAFEVLDAAFGGGVRYFDAARSYGRAEAFLASWIKRQGLDPTDLTVGSKWGYTYTAGWRTDATVNEVKDLSLPALRRQFAASHRLLGANLRLYQVHSATLESGVLEDKHVLDELKRLRDRGLSIGLTVTGPKQPQTIDRAVNTGIFDVVQATWNILEQSAGPALAAAHAAGLGVIVKEPLANGRLTDRGGQAELADVARRVGSTSDAVALSVVLSQPWADVVLSGAATAEELQSNLEALSLPVHAPLIDRLSSLSEDPRTYWSRRAALPWN